MQHLEERLAHLTRLTDDLSEVIARQDVEISRLRREMDRLLRRDAEREAEGTGGIVFGAERPPHY